MHRIDEADQPADQAEIPEGDGNDAVAFLFASQPLDQKAHAEHAPGRESRCRSTACRKDAASASCTRCARYPILQLLVSRRGRDGAAAASARPEDRCTLTSRRPKLVYFDAPVRRGRWFTGTKRPASLRAASARSGSGACDRNREGPGTPRGGTPSGRSRCRWRRRSAAQLRKPLPSREAMRPAGGVLALDPHARHHRRRPVSARSTRQQLGNVGGIVLAVAVQGDDDVAPGRHARRCGCPGSGPDCGRGAAPAVAGSRS